MKYLLIFTVVLIGLWFWRNDRRADSRQANKEPSRRPTPPPGLPTEIVACDVCQVHLPRAEALTGPGGVYCSAAHRQQGEAR